MDYLLEIGTAGQVSIALFIAGIIYASVVHLRHLGFRYRLAFIPFCLLPLVIGLFGLSAGSVGIIEASRRGAIFDSPGMLYHFGEILQIMPVASLATAILLSISFLLLLSKSSESPHT
jgi:hypothetical protein